MRNLIAALVAAFALASGSAAAALLPVDANLYDVRYTVGPLADEVCLFESNVPEDAGLPATLVDRDGSGTVDKDDAILCHVPEFKDDTTPNTVRVTLEAPTADQPIAALAYRTVDGQELVSIPSNVRDLLVQPTPVVILD